MPSGKHDSAALAMQDDEAAMDAVPQARIDAVHDVIAKHVGGSLSHARELASEARVAMMLLAVGTVSFGYALDGLVRALRVSPDRAQLITAELQRLLEPTA